MSASKTSGFRIDWKWLGGFIIFASILFNILSVSVVMETHNRYKNKMIEMSDNHVMIIDSLTKVVTECKPDRIFYDAYLTIQQHERMREHQLQILNKDILWLYAQTNTKQWGDNITPDEFYEALADTALLVNKWH